jgi:alpha-galactosidase
MKTTFSLALILLYTTVSFGQTIDLQKGWKFKTGDDLSWAMPDLNDASWKPIEVNAIWEDQGYPGYDGYAWYRIHVIIPTSLKNNAIFKDSIAINLGLIDDSDQSFLNGMKIGENNGKKGIPWEDAGVYNEQRIYKLASNDHAILWDKENLIAVRVFDGHGGGGIYRGNINISMVSIADFLSFDESQTTSNIIDNKTVAHKVAIRSSAKNMTLGGNLEIAVNDEFQGKILFSKKIKVTVTNEKEFIFEFKSPNAEGVVATYQLTPEKTTTVISKRVEIPYILTPQVAKTARINGPNVFGVRPGNPFLYAIPATGERPMAFSVTNLPQGLTIDKNTGTIKGSIAQKGDYKVTFTAENALGKASKDFKISCGDRICLTPPMGWNSWNCWGLSVSDEKVRQTADTYVNKGLMNHGWTYINIDDGWELVHDPATGKMLCNSKFPDMKKLADYVHSKGLKLGIYSSPGSKTCGMYEASWGYENNDAQLFGEWGIDYLKYDWCSYGWIYPTPDADQLKKPYFVMRDALNKVNRDIVYSLCQYGMGNVWEWGDTVGGNLWRTTGDIEDTWESLSAIGFSQSKSSPFSKPGNWNDPDMLVIGKVGWGPTLHQTRLSTSEQYTHITLWCLLSAPLLIGCDLSQLDDFTLNLLTNDEVIEIDQDPLGKAALKVLSTDVYDLWVKELEDGSKALGIVNKTTTNQKITINLSDAKLTGNQLMRDLWRQKDLGVSTGTFQTIIPGHGTTLVKAIEK